ncbi:MAG: hypothetical protein ABUT20_19010 [Bacteroidota bacterium]
MKKVKLLLLSICVGIVVCAQDGPNGGTTFSVIAIPGSSNTWTNTANASGSDNMYATFGNLPAVAGTYTDYLAISNFSFAIPPNAVISGIEIYVERGDPFRRTSDYSVRILKNGVLGTGERSIGTGYSAFDNYQIYGSNGDLWDETWTPADINDPGFGIAISAKRNAASSTTGGRIDDVQIFVYYDFIVTPVKLLSFSAAKKDDDVQIKWTTIEEIQMDHYEIERSADGRNFATIGTVSSQQQLLQADYSYNDKNPLPGTAYYRLKMVGIAGDVDYSRIVPIHFGSQNRIALYPNPLMQGQNLNIIKQGAEPVTILFYNVSGQQLGNVVTSGNIIPLQSFQNQRGIIFYKILEKNGNLAGTGKLIIQ